MNLLQIFIIFFVTLIYIKKIYNLMDLQDLIYLNLEIHL